MIAVTALLGALLVALIGGRLRPRPTRLLPSAATRARRRLSIGPLVVRPRLIATVFVAAILGGPLVALAVTIVSVIRPRLDRLRGERRRLAAIAVAYPDLVDLLVLTITSGTSPAHAVSTLVPVAPEVTRSALRRIERRLSVGERFADAIAGIRDPPPTGLGAVAQPLADALALADRYGTPLAPMLDRLAIEARDQRRRNAEISARQLPIRLAFPLVGCTLPSFVLLTVVPLMAGTFSSLRGLTA